MGDEIDMAPYFLCAKCGEIFLNLAAYGYCVDINENMQTQLEGHWQLTGFVPQVESAGTSGVSI